MAVNIVSISPVNGAVGVQVHEPIKVLFGTAIDLTTVGIGTVFVEGSDKEVQSGPYVPINFQTNDPLEPFKEPAYYGLVQGNYSYEYYSTDGITLLSNLEDTSGTDQYYTQVIFEPLRHLSPNHPYKLYVVGTSTDTVDIGIASRSVFDPIPNGANTGNGDIVSHGGYRGTIDGTFTIDLVSAGVIGDASYRWKFNSGSYQPINLTHSHKRILQDNVSVSFSPEGTFQTGDNFTFLVKPKDFLSNINIGTFVTGELGTQVIPTDTSHLISRAAPPFSGAAEPGFSLDHTFPLNLECDISNTNQSFNFYFNKQLSTTFDTNGMQVYIGPANGDTCIREETSFTPNNVFVNGTCLQIYIQSPVPVDGFGLQVFSTDT